MMILIAGPYRSGTNDDPKLIAANVHAMTEMARQHGKHVFFQLEDIPPV